MLAQSDSDSLDRGFRLRGEKQEFTVVGEGACVVSLLSARIFDD